MLCNFIEMALRHGCSPTNLLDIFRIPFPKNTNGWLLPSVRYQGLRVLLVVHLMKGFINHTVL